jgi:hypothetical protein
VKINIILFISLIFTLFLSADETADTKKNNDEIKFIQLFSVSNYSYYKHGLRLYFKDDFVNAMSDNKEALDMYLSALNKYYGLSAMLGIGIGLSAATTFSTFIFSILAMSFNPVFIGLAPASGFLFVGGIIMWGCGAYHRAYFKKKIHEAVLFYNSKQKENKTSSIERNLYFSAMPILKDIKTKDVAVYLEFGISL